MKITTLQVQRRLNALGFNAGPEDGIRGAKTIAAVRAFQKSKRLVVDGLVGPKTAGKLFAEKGQRFKPVSATKVPDNWPWVDIAERKMGLHERIHNKSLMEFLSFGGRTIGDPAKIPWCGDLVETCITMALPEEPVPQNPYAAINWLKFGISCNPQPGAILVFWRGSPQSWKGHVGFYVGEDATHYHVLGGNQKNSISITRIAKSRLREDGVRWPSTAMAPVGSALRKSSVGLLSTVNEA